MFSKPTNINHKYDNLTDEQLKMLSQKTQAFIDSLPAPEKIKESNDKLRALLTEARELIPQSALDEIDKHKNDEAQTSNTLQLKR